MTADANKSHLTRLVTATAMCWMFEKGFKPLAAEVRVKDGWTADAAGLSELTRTEAKALKLIPGVNTKLRDAVLFDDSVAGMTRYVQVLYQRSQQQQREMSVIPSPLTAVLEVKTTRADYRADVTRKFGADADPVAHLQFIAVPRGMIDPDCYPPGWGVLLYFKNGVRVAKYPTLREPMMQQTLRLAFSVGHKVDCDRRYEKMRASQKEERCTLTNRRVLCRLDDVAKWMSQLVRGDEPTYGFNRQPQALQQKVRDAVEKLKNRLPELQPDKEFKKILLDTAGASGG